ncbi:hypothetical protein U27_05729 [Candidatus Vecturithrix granuli]|uniref:N-acetyltransferase domain-containing protein n=1 Tax=Vecturithrix granuli TaxID=1499967 RepID=A0A081C2E9_VECG1|nr:hypothetical protein U27_05729 [Candidatus Vecturithrix granuli]
MDNYEFMFANSLKEIEGMRAHYLDELGEAQELFLELKIRRARVVKIQSYARPIGYVLLGDDNLLLEYFISRTHFHQIDRIFQDLIQKFSIKKAFCKSFDHALLSCCVQAQKQTKAVGVLFRERDLRSLSLLGEHVTTRFAEPHDAQQIAAVNEEVFDNKEEIDEVIANHNLFIFEQDHDLIGVGLFQRVIVGRPEFDIGMLVTSKYRRQGYGAAIIHYLADYCQQQGWRPICGCAIENIASRRCLEKTGFIARYRMLEFTF